jgi:hypothetical protein
MLQIFFILWGVGSVTLPTPFNGSAAGRGAPPRGRSRL